MMTLIIALGVLLLLFFCIVIAHTSTRLSFLEKEAEVIDFIEVRNDSESPERITGYKPVVRFEVGGKLYQNTANVFPLWENNVDKSVIILYNPQNPTEFKVKELSNNPVIGCIFVIFIIIAVGVTIYFYLHDT
jgi:hypothetical protein